MKAKEVLEILKISRITLTKYHRIGLIKIDSTINGQYNYNEESVYALVGLKKKKQKKSNVIYSRVSNLPKKYLDEQNKRLLDFCTSKGLEITTIYSDIKSGMNFDRKDFQSLILEIVKGKIGIIVVENKDRLARFGFELFESFCKFYKTTILIANKLTEQFYEEELTQDLISIIHHFSMKSYSHRRKLNKIKKDLETIDETTSENIKD